MIILYVTDLHGNESKYKKLLNKAIEAKADLVINGGDMFPKNIDLSQQGKWISGFFKKHLSKYREANIKYACMPGNDDLQAFDPLFEDIVKSEDAISLAGKLVKINDWSLIGFNLVPDYPFRLKDRCRMDTRNFIFERQFGSGLLSSISSGEAVLEEIEEGWIEYANGIPTIKNELEILPLPEDMYKAIYVMHSPPCGLDLDVCHGKRAVGSKSIREFINTFQPAVTLHGHIHESFEETGYWKNNIKETICIQPGQMKKLSYVKMIIEGENITVERFDS